MTATLRPTRSVRSADNGGQNGQQFAEWNFSWNWNWVQEIAIAWYRRSSRAYTYIPTIQYICQIVRWPDAFEAAHFFFSPIDEVSVVFRLLTTHTNYAAAEKRLPRKITFVLNLHWKIAEVEHSHFVWQLALRHSQFPITLLGLCAMHWNYLRSIHVSRSPKIGQSRINTIFLFRIPFSSFWTVRYVESLRCREGETRNKKRTHVI